MPAAPMAPTKTEGAKVNKKVNKLQHIKLRQET
jgi:hypothetical protein